MVSTSVHTANLNDIFSTAGGSNYFEHHPLEFRAIGEKGKVDSVTLREQYIELFQNIAQTTLQKDYIHSIIKPHKKLVIHPSDVKVLESRHDYYFNQWAFRCENLGDFPLIKLETYDFRRPEHRENESSVFLRFTYGTQENKQKLFDAFEKIIRGSKIPYKRDHLEIGLGSLDFEFKFEDANPRGLRG